MEAEDLQQLLSDQWKSAVNSCRNTLERDDLRQVLDFNSWDDLQDQISKGRVDQTTHREFTMLAPSIIKLRTFIDRWICQVGPKVDASVLWGFMRLVVKLAHDEKAAISRVFRMLRDVCYKVEILNNYFAKATSFTPELKESCIECGIVLLSLFSYIIEFMRRDVVYSTPACSTDAEWHSLGEQFTSSSRQIDELLYRVEKLSKFAEHFRRTDSFEPSRQMEPLPTTPAMPIHLYPPEEQAKLPCVILPKIRTSRFFDRADVIQRMEDYFNEADPERSFRSLAIHGLGGVGKSTVALRYAEAKLKREELDALFWVYSEKLVSMRQSFTEIALRLKLPDARPGDHDENQALVLNWLQHTQCKWLIVYDNAEVADLIRAYWPLASRGQALVTTRNPSIAFELADRGMEVTSWDHETGLRFLLHLLSSEISTDLQEDEAESAQQLSHKLCGHALAISTMAGLIHRRALSITEFTKFYEQHPSQMHGISGSRSINALWEISFRSLNSPSHAILGVMSFIEPDNIPQSLFEPDSRTDLPDPLRFCSDGFRFSEAIEDLLTLALIKRDRISRTFSLHRLVQTSFKYFLTPKQRQEAFGNATVLVSRAFPRRDSNIAQLYLMWDRCVLYVQHVISLKDCFREEKKNNPEFRGLQTYCDLNNACQRYLLEMNSYEELEDLIEVNTLALDTLPQEQQTVGLQGSLTSHRGQLLIRLGKAEEGVKWLKKSYEIRSHDKPFNPRESSWAADNVAVGIATLNNFTEATKWHERARDHFLEWSNKQPKNKGEWPAEIMNSMGLGLVWSGQSQRARDLMMGALEQVESTEPYNWAVASYTHFGLGTVERRDMNFESAEAHFMEAQNLWLKGNQMRSDPFNAACMYRLGCTSLDQGHIEAAVKHLRDALVVTEMRKHNMVAEHMRCLFKLSEALEQEPREVDEARRLREDAEYLLRRRAPNAGNPGLASTYDSLVNILWR
ncbi:NB-ARC and TPR domain protein [Lojkania enalia]|uniref:NB-ARC and TPR domain protein n=1 Tax=Lojkania enalia TaxID=147567 RepID=A0A9P4MVP5_9PLEO|nr:NB-ARC and TPR domain protein [Didymosphaeria enalia]